MSHMRNLEVGSVQQALVVGQVVNGLTGDAISSLFSIDLDMRIAGETEFMPFPVEAKIISAGFFSFPATAERVLPQLITPADTLEFRFTVIAPGFTSFEEIVAVSAASITPVETTLDIAGHSLDVSLVSAPILQRTLMLTPQAVGLRGMVIDDNDPDSPLAGVSVQVVAPEAGEVVLSDVQGRYRIDSLPVAESVTLQVEVDDDLTDITHVIDYSNPFNTRIISLNG